MRAKLSQWKDWLVYPYLKDDVKKELKIPTFPNKFLHMYVVIQKKGKRDFYSQQNFLVNSRITSYKYLYKAGNNIRQFQAILFIHYLSNSNM